jgi:signal transduction histidine kinase
MTHFPKSWLLVAAAVLILWLAAISVFIWRPFDPGLNFQITNGQITIATVETGSQAYFLGLQPGDQVIGFDRTVTSSAVPANWQVVEIRRNSQLLFLSRSGSSPDNPLPPMFLGSATLLLLWAGWLLFKGRRTFLALTSLSTALLLPIFYGHLPYSDLLLFSFMIFGVIQVQTLRRVTRFLSCLELGLFLGLYFNLGSTTAPDLFRWNLLSVLLSALILTPLLAEIDLLARTRWRAARQKQRMYAAVGVQDRSLLWAEYFPWLARWRNAAKQEEQVRLGQDLHAEVLPYLASAIARTSDPQTKKQLLLAQGKLRDLMAQRRLPILEQEGLICALEWLAEQIQAASEMEVDLSINPTSEEARPPRGVELAMFRVAQLALSNILEHAQAQHVVINLVVGPTQVVMEILDDGVGLTQDQKGPTSNLGARGLGFLEMHQQALAVEGDLQIGRRALTGMEVIFRWPRQS